MSSKSIILKIFNFIRKNNFHNYQFSYYPEFLSKLLEFLKIIFINLFKIY